MPTTPELVPSKPEALEYLQAIGALYDWIGRVVPASFRTSRPGSALVEEGGEEYAAPALYVTPEGADQAVKFVPRGYAWGGAKGRVDVLGHGSREVLLLLDEADPDLAALPPLRPKNPKSVPTGGDQPEVATGWVLQQSPHIGLNPSLSVDLLHRLLEVSSR